MTITDEQLKKHTDNLTTIYKKLFGYFRTDDPEAKAEIEAEARELADEIAKETKRLLENSGVSTGTKTK
jgi:hypothetical protein